jgi:hypothetical protein
MITLGQNNLISDKFDWRVFWVIDCNAGHCQIDLLNHMITFSVIAITSLHCTFNIITISFIFNSWCTYCRSVKIFFNRFSFVRFTQSYFWYETNCQRKMFWKRQFLIWDDLSSKAFLFHLFPDIVRMK